ncbi:MAG TPA: metallophosphoesterase [Bryobacteraceae bacterium]|nr:metallophosphoesterase [Bryobacteraceae bacterium]
MLFRVHFFPGLCLLFLGLGLQIPVVRWLLDSYRQRRLIWLGAAASTALLLAGYILEFQRVLRYFPVQWWTWLECASLVETMWLIGFSLALAVWRRAPQFSPARRKMLQAAGAGLCIVPLAATAVGIVRRNRFRLSEVPVPIPNLPKDLEGLRIVQITDIHLSPFLSEREFAMAIDMANETRANLALVTGDLITRPGDPLDACLRQLARLRADSGILGCLGNHEIYARVENYVTEQGRRIGIDFLRHQARQLRFGNATINFAGVDYQRMNSHYLKGMDQLIVPGAVNVMLSHNPDVFPMAASQGYALTVAGHTHGGQVDVEILHQHLNVARYFTPFVQGLYRRGNSSVYVSNGLGTIGVPVRLGAPPEVSVLRLCAI